MKSMGLTAALILYCLSISARAQTFRSSSAYLSTPLTADGKPAPSPWDATIRYGVSTNYADTRTPRGYDHVLLGEIGYKINPRWDGSLALGVRAETVNGQIPKGQQQSYSETLNPSTGLAVSYGDKFYAHSYSVGVHGEPLFDEDARLEGHKGLIGADASVLFNFFTKRVSMRHSLDGSSLLHTYEYGSDLRANPDYFWTYKWKNDLRFARTWKVSYTFGAKVTRYLDGFVGYSYNNTYSVSKTWKSATVAVTYDNGGFTDEGYVRLWYIDQYRRVARLMVSYAF